MNVRRGISRGRCALTTLLLALTSVGVACGSSGAPSSMPSESTTVANPAALVTPAAVIPDRPNLPPVEVVAALEGRMAAMNKGDGAAAAAFYTPDAVLEETDLTPHVISLGRDDLATRFNDLYGMGLRLAPAGAPIAYDRYVAEPVRFYNGIQPGRGAAMLVFEIGPGNRLAYQWMIGWAGGPEKTFAILPSPSVDQPNLPPRRIMRILNGRMTAMNRGDGQAAAAFYAKNGVTEEMGQYPSRVAKGREAIAAKLEGLYQGGLRLAPAGVPITYDKYVAEPVRFSNSNGPSAGAGMLVFEFDPTYKIAHEWVIGWVRG